MDHRPKAAHPALPDAIRYTEAPARNPDGSYNPAHLKRGGSACSSGNRPRNDPSPETGLGQGNGEPNQEPANVRPRPANLAALPRIAASRRPVELPACESGNSGRAYQSS